MRFYLLLLFTFSTICVFAQRQNVYYYKNNGKQVNIRDSADYTRIIREPDSGSVLYKVLEYYMNGKPRRMGQSSTIEPVKLEGICTGYYEDGKRKNVLNYHNGFLAKEQFYYYPNGKLSEVKNYPDSLNKNKSTFNQVYLITTFNDISGEALLTNGNGRYKIYNKDYTKATTEGEVKNGLKDGEWHITVRNDSLLINETYIKGKLIMGKAKMANGETYTYTISEALPEFKGGIQGFYKFLSSTLRYPCEAQERKIQGRVQVSFIVEKDGTLTNVRETGISPGEMLSVEAIRVINQSPKWNPGIQYGRPARVTYTVPVVFSLR